MDVMIIKNNSRCVGIVQNLELYSKIKLRDALPQNYVILPIAQVPVEIQDYYFHKLVVAVYGVLP